MALTRNSDAVAPLRSSGPVSIWLGRHLQTAQSSLAKLVRQPFSSLMIVLVIAVTLSLPAAASLVIKNAQAISGGWANALDFSVYLRPGISNDDAKVLVNLIEKRADVASVQLITPSEALAQFKQQSGFGDALDQLQANPLPTTLVVRPAAANNGQSMSLLQEELDNLPETDLVQVDTVWVQRFHAILTIVRKAILLGGVLLGGAIIVIIGNTIRLDIQNRRDEIEVTKLIGASNAFVRRPFLWTGFWYGLFGGLMGLAFIAWGLHVLDDPVSRLAGLYESKVTLLALDAQESAAIVGASVLFGLLGSWLASARHMRRIEPR